MQIRKEVSHVVPVQFAFSFKQLIFHIEFHEPKSMVTTYPKHQHSHMLSTNMYHSLMCGMQRKK